MKKLFKQNQLKGEIKSKLELLKTLDSDDEKYSETLDELKELYTIEGKRREQTDDRFVKFAKIGIDLLGVALPMVLYASWFPKMMKYEETGTFPTSKAGKDMLNNFYRKLK